MKVSHEEVLTQKDAIETKLASERAEIDLLINKKTVLLGKRDELMKKIRDLGSVPSDVDKYSRKSIRDLKAILSKCNQELQKYGHVNKKALDQVFDGERVSDIICMQHNYCFPSTEYTRSAFEKTVRQLYGTARESTCTVSRA